MPETTRQPVHIYRYTIPILQILNILITIYYIITNFKAIIIYPSLLAFTVVVIIFTIGFLVGIKIATMDENCDGTVTRKEDRCKRDLALGYGGMAICGWILQICIPPMRKSLENLYSIAIGCTFISITFYILFILQNIRKYRINDSKRDPNKVRILSCIPHFAFAWLTIQATKTREDLGKEKISEICAFTSFYTMIFLFVTGELGALLACDMTLIEGGEGDDEMRNVEDREILDRLNCSSYSTGSHVPPVPHSSSVTRLATVLRPTVSTSTTYRPSIEPLSKIVPKPTVPASSTVPLTTVSRQIDDSTSRHQNGTECNICLIEYSNHSTIPRILIGCGHTVCQKCIAKLTRELDNQVLCPFCRKGTKLPDGQAEQLPKNYAVLDIIQDQQS